MALSGAELAALVAVPAAAGAVLSSWLTARATSRTAARQSSGRVATSDAGQIFDAANALIISLQAENAKLIGQRDKLVDAFGRLLPMVEGIVASQERDDEMTSRVLDLLESRTALFARITVMIERVTGMIEARDRAISQILALLGERGAADGTAADRPAGPADSPGA